MPRDDDPSPRSKSATDLPGGRIYTVKPVYEGGPLAGYELLNSKGETLGTVQLARRVTDGELYLTPDTGPAIRHMEKHRDRHLELRETLVELNSLPHVDRSNPDNTENEDQRFTKRLDLLFRATDLLVALIPDLGRGHGSAGAARQQELVATILQKKEVSDRELKYCLQNEPDLGYPDESTINRRLRAQRDHEAATSEQPLTDKERRERNAAEDQRIRHKIENYTTVAETSNQGTD